MPCRADCELRPLFDLEAGTNAHLKGGILHFCVPPFVLKQSG